MVRRPPRRAAPTALRNGGLSTEKSQLEAQLNFTYAVSPPLPPPPHSEVATKQAAAVASSSRRAVAPTPSVFFNSP